MAAHPDLAHSATAQRSSRFRIASSLGQPPAVRGSLRARRAGDPSSATREDRPRRHTRTVRGGTARHGLQAERRIKEQLDVAFGCVHGGRGSASYCRRRMLPLTRVEVSCSRSVTVLAGGYQSIKFDLCICTNVYLVHYEYWIYAPDLLRLGGWLVGR